MALNTQLDVSFLLFIFMCNFTSLCLRLFCFKSKTCPILEDAHWYTLEKTQMLKHLELRAFSGPYLETQSETDTAVSAVKR